ncbi:MAG: hypothetical protein ACYCSF_08140 [Acidimicrobiales bacterium]
MSRYAENTTVATDRSRAEIERTLQRYGASAFAYGWTDNQAMIQFEAHERRIRFVLPMPDRNDPEFTLTPTGKARSDAQALGSWEQAQRQRWRALALVVKAKLEAVEAGVATFEDEFLAYTVLPNGSTAGDWIRPQIARAYESGTMPALLPALGR